VFDHPRASLALLAALTLAFAAGLPRLETDVGYRSVLGRQHPTVARFEAFLGRFGGGFPLAAVYDCTGIPACDSVFDPDALRTAAAIAGSLAAEPSIRRVDSVATTPLLLPGEEGEVAVRHLVEQGAAAADREHLARRALRDSLWPRWLLDAEGRVGAIVIEVASSRSRDQVAAYAALEAALAPHEARGYRFQRVGGPVEFVVAGTELQADTARLVPLMVALVAGVLIALFRSVGIAVAALVTVGVGVIWTFGAMGWLGWSENSVTQALPPLLLVIGVCDGIHLLARMAGIAVEQPGRPRRETVLAAVRDVGGPCLLTTLTTAAGFASFASSALESFVRFGLAASFGVCAALLLTFTLLPLLALRLPLAHPPAARAALRWERTLTALVGFARRRAAPLLLATLAIGGVLAFGVGALRVDASFEDLYGVESPVVRWAHYVSDHLRRPDSLEVELLPPEGTHPNEPESLQVVEAAAASLAGIAGLGPARSAVDWISLVHQLANDDEPFWYRLPGRREDVDEIVDALDERDPAALGHWIAREPVGYRISLESEKLPQEEMRRVFAQSESRLGATLPEDWRWQLTGPFAVVHDMIDEIQRTQLWSFGLAAVVVLVLVALFLRSLRLAALALLPTVLPVLATLGAMGWWGAPLDVGSAMVAAIVIGVAVDDCIHLLSVYESRRSEGLVRADAMAQAVMQVGRAVVTTSLALALGFFALTLSSWSTIAHFGVLAGLAILVALLAVVVLLPAAMGALTPSHR
jgi:predicted RND superfamily exporter protein